MWKDRRCFRNIRLWGLYVCINIRLLLNRINLIIFHQANVADSYWDRLRKMQPNGPLVNSEYYPGWLTHWQEQMQRVDTNQIIPTFRFDIKTSFDSMYGF